MNWHDLHPVVKIFIWSIIFFLIIGGFGYILFIINRGIDKMEAKEKQIASVPIDSIPLIYDCKGNRKEVRRELYEDMKGRGKGNV
jgi:hypothetical protein